LSFRQGGRCPEEDAGRIIPKLLAAAFRPRESIGSSAGEGHDEAVLSIDLEDDKVRCASRETLDLD
jgi:hypothetical protein